MLLVRKVARFYQFPHLEWRVYSWRARTMKRERERERVREIGREEEEKQEDKSD